MVLPLGTRLGPYEVTAQIGVGGMGEVYRATDTNLKRQVAIKVLPASVAGDAERLARFQREAEVLASLNHPNIAAIYGLERSGGTTALVMELVEGPTLADRIARGAIPVDEALPIATQIADALEAAHERGIIHRDLKPANVKVRPDGMVKVLDFGLAKALDAGAGSQEQDPTYMLSQSPTLSVAATRMGVILGTAAYMSPEQAKGRTVDRRSDVWAFGAVLYEMLTGRRAFGGDDISDTLANVLKVEPNWDALPSGLSPTLVVYTRRCLYKDSKQRLGDIHDMRLALEGAFDTAGSQSGDAGIAPRRRAWQRPLPLALAASLVTAVVVGAVVGIAVRGLAPTQERQVSRFEYDLPAGQQFRNTGRPLIAFSRDGRRFVYNTTQGLYLRAMDERDAHVIPGTEANLISPFFSPDGQSVGYWQDGQLKRLAITGGAPVVIGGAENPFGVSWETDNTILFGQPKGIMRVPATGGTPELVIPAKDGEQFYGPQLLPDGDSVLFSLTTLSGTSRWDRAQVVVQSLRSSERTVLLQGGSDARFVPTGHLVYALEEGLFAVPFDADRRQVKGGAVPLEQGIMRATVPDVNTASANYGVSEEGTLVYIRSMPGVGQGTLTWVTRDGRETPLTTLALDQPRNPRLSPDGERLAVVVAGALWVYDVAGRPPIKLTSYGDYFSPLWTPDGQRLVIEGGGAASDHLSILPADGSGTLQAVSPAGHFHPHGWSADGDLVAVRLNTPGTGSDIVRWSLAKPDVIQNVLETPAAEGWRGAMLSPDGRWLAYASDQTGQQEIWVRPYPGPGAAVRISPNGGVEPVWARSGRELHYLEGTRLMAITVTAGDRFNFSPATLLFDNNYLLSNLPPSYDVAPDGRFLMIKPIGGNTDVAPSQIVVIQNWTEELKRLVPTN